MTIALAINVSTSDAGMEYSTPSRPKRSGSSVDAHGSAPVSGRKTA